MPVGYRAGGWEVTARIASGSWASVYAARRVQSPGAPDDPLQGHSGALKFLPGGALSPPQYAGLQQAVREEIRFNEEVDHPRLIRTFETFVIDDPGEPQLHGAVVLAMERAAASLQDVLDTVTPPDPVPDAAQVIAEICEAFAHVHAQGWVHGDIKPSNVLLMQDGSVRLADFGLARELEGTHAYSPRLGSSDYLPPEWWTERIGAQGIATRTTADIWALGVTAHQLLTGGMLAFPGATARARGAAAQAYADGQADLRLVDGLAPGWRAVIADCLACDHPGGSRVPAVEPLADHSGAALGVPPAVVGGDLTGLLDDGRLRIHLLPQAVAQAGGDRGSGHDVLHFSLSRIGCRVVIQCMNTHDEWLWPSRISNECAVFKWVGER